MRSTCGGYKAGQMPNQSVPVFLTEQIAVCPGHVAAYKSGELGWFRDDRWGENILKKVVLRCFESGGYICW